MWRIISNSIVLDLIQTAATISHTLYSPPSERTPRNVLQLHNVCWLHHELCLSLSPSLIGTKVFGFYYHLLFITFFIIIHGPVQYEIVCLMMEDLKNLVVLKKKTFVLSPGTYLASLTVSSTGGQCMYGQSVLSQPDHFLHNLYLYFFPVKNIASMLA